MELKMDYDLCWPRQILPASKAGSTIQDQTPLEN